jgi:Flp pilus assembly protein TadD/peroxiredoxin
VSQSPIDDFSERTILRYRQGWKALNRLLHEDRSFSGHERNCVFLNVRGEDGGGSERFADISAASGFDFADDGRALALCDWDFDGDLDIWVVNRTAPRIRLLRNNSSRENHFVAIKLQGDGQRTNRDAIGARVEVVLAGDQARTLVKTVSAGDSFLSQSSSWLQFGLGDATEIRQVVVRWPGGERREYADLEIDRRYIIDQASDQATPWTAPLNRKPLIASPQEPLTTTDVARTVLPARRLLPTLRIEENKPLNTMISRPTVISIWSATCASCIEELHEYTRNAERLREAGLDVIAINLDNLEGDSGKATGILQKMAFPFATAFGTTELVRSLDVLKRAIFDRWQTLTVPTSFLVDEDGFVCTIYQGPVSIDQLLSDLELLDVPSDELRSHSSPFPGHWIMPPPTADPLQVVSRFIDEAMVSHGVDYLERHAQRAEVMPDSDSQEPGDLFYVLAILLREQQQIDAARNAFREAIECRPDDFRFRSDYASLLAETGNLAEAAVQLQHALRISPNDASVHRKLAFVWMAQKDYSAAIEWFKKTLEMQPNDVACWYNLANAYRASGQMDEALRTYRHTLALQPQMILAANNLAWVLATHPQSELRDGTEAVRWAEQVCEQTQYAQPSFLDTLACAHAENGDFERAISVASKAVQILTEQGQSAAAANIETRLQLFQQNLPYRDQPR